MKLDVSVLSVGNIFVFGFTKCRGWNIPRFLSCFVKSAQYIYGEVKT